jgi:hypothetical protein
MAIHKEVRYEGGVTNIFEPIHKYQVGRDSSVGIATGYGLDGPGIDSRWG